MAVRKPDGGLRIAVVNQSSTTIQPYVIDAIQRQLDEHFSPVWNRTATLRLIDDASQLRPNEACAQLLDHTDYPGLLGYHFCAANGAPGLRVFARTASDYGQEFSAVLSHEILETTGNPWVNAAVLQNLGKGSGILYSMEVCDPVERSFYQIDGVTVSNFVTPQYFLGNSSAPYDYMGLLSTPMRPAQDGNQRMQAVSGLPSL